MEETNASLPPLDDVEARVLGSLVEKAATTPDIYPLTENAILTACNQKTNREPVMHLEPGAVGNALRRLESRGLVRVAPISQRARRYEHRFDEVYGTTARQRAVLCLLLLRGPQTPGELLTRSERLVEFPSLDDVRDTLERLGGREPALVTCIGRAGGQREDRWMHLLAGPVDAAALLAAAPAAARGGGADAGLGERVLQLENGLEALRAELERLRGIVEALGG